MLSVMPLVVVMALSVPLATTVGFLILLKTGPWAVPLFLCYLALLMVPGNYAATLRENNNLRFIKGDEIYYTEHPQALHKALRLARKKGVAPERRAFVQQIQQEPLPVFPENPADAKRIRRAQGRFLLSGLLLLALGAFLLWRGWALYEPNRLSGRRQFSYSFLFPLLGALPVIATGLLACMKRRIRILFPATLV
ncbi:MAG: hypothetical protein J6H18_04630, partial [Lachnospiraceae bacterium]|nr:hypothetical protein [Lachnospiraceae bacterium]